MHRSIVGEPKSPTRLMNAEIGESIGSYCNSMQRLNHLREFTSNGCLEPLASRVLGGFPRVVRRTDFAETPVHLIGRQFTRRQQLLTYRGGVFLLSSRQLL